MKLNTVIELERRPGLSFAEVIGQRHVVESLDRAAQSLSTLAARLGRPPRTVRDVVEPYLLRRGLVVITPPRAGARRPDTMIVMVDEPYVKPDRPSPEQVAAWKRMTLHQKLALADQMRSTAIRLRRARLEQEHPELSEAEIQERVRRFVTYGGA